MLSPEAALPQSLSAPVAAIENQQSGVTLLSTSTATIGSSQNSKSSGKDSAGALASPSAPAVGEEVDALPIDRLNLARQSTLLEGEVPLGTDSSSDVAKDKGDS